MCENVWSAKQKEEKDKKGIFIEVLIPQDYFFENHYKDEIFNEHINKGQQDIYE